MKWNTTYTASLSSHDGRRGCGSPFHPPPSLPTDTHINMRSCMYWLYAELAPRL